MNGILLCGYVALLSACSGLPALAASAQTDAFTSVVRLDIAFLSQSSSLASERSEYSKLRAFAEREMSAYAIGAAALDTRTVLPIDQNVAMNADDLMTGRSAAVNGRIAPLNGQPAETGATLPAAKIALDHLMASTGSAFDILYKSSQIKVLRQLAALYSAYSLYGDDAALQQMARIELKATNERVTALSGL